jgi:endonuclease G
VALRENRIVDLPGSFMHYETDTEPGSSGSPVFNDQWEVVALHHASVRAQNHPELGGFLNEGIRISRILQFVRAQSLPVAARPLVDQLFEPERIEVPLSPAPSPDGNGASPQPIAAPPVATDDGAVRLTVPLEITVRLGTQAPVEVPAEAPVEDGDVAEKIEIDPNYANRRGYDPSFLGDGAHRIPLPRLPDNLYAKTSKKADAAGGGRHVLPYYHYSVVMNMERRLAFFTAVNVNGRLSRRLTRERDKWALDPRIPAGEQTGEAVYRDNPLDRGHLVRRLDPAWGQTLFVAKRANDDTFHFTNCTPQHEDFNQNKTTWAGLEDYILENADNRDLRVTVFTGPVLADDDDQYRGVQLPRQYWKVVAMVKRNGDLSATAYLLSQERLIDGLEIAEAFSYGAYRTFQVPVSRVEAMTRLSFGALADADPLAGLEATTEAREIASATDIVL